MYCSWAEWEEAPGQDVEPGWEDVEEHGPCRNWTNLLYNLWRLSLKRFGIRLWPIEWSESEGKFQWRIEPSSDEPQSEPEQ